VISQVARPGIRAAHLRRVVAHVLRAEDVPTSASVTVVLVTDAMIRRLNRRFLDKDRPTDVLAFPGEPPALGEVAISVQRARAQARAIGHPAAVEIALLAAHGTLHLLGYDDRAAADRARMMRRQAALLGEMGIRVRG